MATNNSIDLSITITITAKSDGTFDLTCATNHDYDRLDVERGAMRVEVANMLAELVEEVSSASFWPSGRDW